jgi:ribosomal protein S18 acetylase RimI-like enzyme
MYIFRLLCALVMCLGITQAIDCQEQFFCERNKTMANQNRNSRTFSALDAKRNPIILQWNTFDDKSPKLTQQIRNASDILIETYTQQELEFAHKHPEAVKDQHFLKSLAPLFEGSAINWKTVEVQIRNIFQQYFTGTDFAQFFKEGEKHILITAADQTTGKVLGFIQFITSPDYPTNSIKAGMFGIANIGHSRGIEELLMSSIFKLLPGTQRIFIHVRSTNEKALALYQSWGFSPMGTQQGYWMNLEYLTQTNTHLQKKAEFLK